MKKINKAYKCRIYPNKKQQQFIDDSIRSNNFIYNYFLGKNDEIKNGLKKMYGLNDKESINSYRKEHKLYFNKGESSKHITKLKKLPKYEFLNKMDATSTHYTLLSLEKAFDGMRRGGGYPKYKNKKSRQSFTGQMSYKGDKPNFSIKRENKKWCLLDIPKLKKIKSNIHYDILHNYTDKKIIKFNSYTITKESNGDYYISFSCEIQISSNNLSPIEKDSSIGIDFGVERPVTTSRPEDFDDELYSNRFDIIKNHQEEKTRLSRIISNKKGSKKGEKRSNKYNRIRIKISNLDKKISNIRNNRQHNITTKLTKSTEYNTIIVEDLKIKNMTKRSAKGKSNNKSGLNRVMLDVGIGEMNRQLEYKSMWYGKSFFKIDPKNTSRQCSRCGHTEKQNRKTQSKFTCVKCNHSENADFNAAKNIKEKYFNLNKL